MPLQYLFYFVLFCSILFHCFTVPVVCAPLLFQMIFQYANKFMMRVERLLRMIGTTSSIISSLVLLYAKNRRLLAIMMVLMPLRIAWCVDD